MPRGECMDAGRAVIGKNHPGVSALLQNRGVDDSLRALHRVALASGLPLPITLKTAKKEPPHD
eukprot:4459836-Prymnesium_polylepis.2